MPETVLTGPFTLKLPMNPGSVPQARKALQQALAAWEVEEAVIADVLLIASELGGNAVRHARVPGRLWQLIAVRLARAVRVEVTDADGDRMPVLLPDGPFAEQGRGLHLVESLTGGTWGITKRVIGKTIWAEIPCPSPATARTTHSTPCPRTLV